MSDHGRRPWEDRSASPRDRAEALVAAMTVEQKIAQLHGVMKTYNKPFSKTVHEALLSPDYKWAKWKDGKLVAYGDDVIKSLKDADFKK